MTQIISVYRKRGLRWHHAMSVSSHSESTKWLGTKITELLEQNGEIKLVLEMTTDPWWDNDEG